MSVLTTAKQPRQHNGGLAGKQGITVDVHMCNAELSSVHPVAEKGGG